jgi:hypothetical protein
MRQNHAHSVEQEVEWLYAFDVHQNAFFCSFLLTYVVQYFLLPILLSRSVLSCVLSNALYAVATIWYAYITHLGYRALPFLGNTQVFLWYPIVTGTSGRHHMYRIYRRRMQYMCVYAVLLCLLL